MLKASVDDIPMDVWWLGLKPQATMTGLKLTMPINATGMKLGTLFTVAPISTVGMGRTKGPGSRRILFMDYLQ
jgi:hypothetical protein